jgi:hypothetical protein
VEASNQLPFDGDAVSMVPSSGTVAQLQVAASTGIAVNKIAAPSPVEQASFFIGVSFSA